MRQSRPRYDMADYLALVEFDDEAMCEALGDARCDDEDDQEAEP